MISVRFQDKPFNITVIQVYVPTSNAEEAEVEWFYEPTRPFRTNTQKRCPFHYRGLEWMNLTQMTIVSATVGRNPSEEMQ